jgi:asparagine synthase (glutamine-hydrolysing)
VPGAVLAKRKQGFAIPLRRWFGDELRPLMQDTLASRTFRERGYFDPTVADRLLADHVAGRADHGEHLWLILGFELWARRCLDAGRPAA